MSFYDDLMESLTEVKEHLEGKRTLRTETLSRSEPLHISADEVKAIRARLNLSQAVFAQRLRTSIKTYQGWEQGKSTPNHRQLFYCDWLNSPHRYLNKSHVFKISAVDEN
ncbi:putative zinc finger/helix-turn-helix protein, YgiT family [Mannheimia haemolytica]|uniref:Putative zinc finger/helix-turn-helix protein, YgiT family n=1 Tax=Mannheimia haemolytica TaxID=75985 RepID=A0A378MS46_MANHA|nr:putative zinc finger/helix-turn-helix protein, YgiT family [Mannheimia haemolytica]